MSIWSASSSATRTTTRSTCAASPRPVITAWCSSARAASRRPSASACACSPRRIWRRRRPISRKPDCRRNGSRCRIRAARCTSSTRSGAPIEFCATMELKPRLIVEFEHHRGAVPQRLDHFQLLVPDVQQACEFWMELGFRLSEYISPDGSEELLFVFLQRKGNPHDIVFARGAGAAAASRRLRPSRNPISSSMSAISPPIWALRPISNLAPAGTVPAMRCSSICAIPTVTASSCSTPTTRCMDIENEPVRWDLSLCGQAPLAAARRAGNGTSRRAASPASSRASRRTRAIR